LPRCRRLHRQEIRRPNAHGVRERNVRQADRRARSSYGVTCRLAPRRTINVSRRPAP
jgi:hypothetical protein